MLRKEYGWFLDHPEIIAQYSGEYIAIVGDKVVAHGRSFKAVFEEAERHGRPLVHKVQPTDKEVIL
ncbi:MAG TPA: DUF5678 domain-containing protein [Thermoanaerobaculia bacterium]|jgi:hypothetical protein